mgnify:CR=1 FL=1
MTVAHYHILKRFHKRMVRSEPNHEWNVLIVAWVALALAFLLS